ncbi:MAG: exodeoxyribonuclease V subunit alpha [Fibromonadales bacterium]|nr:exodeoxyribonuclease V subunit alpha [Fibromonadales bacterium]
MTEEISNIDKVLLSYLEEKYKVEKDSALYNAAKLLLQRLWQGSICIPFSEDRLNNSPAVGKSSEIRPLIFHENNLYIQRYFVYQKNILERIEKLNLRIITGGPGTGKTTSLANILKNRLNKKILLAAPTGKAALRMKESLDGQGIRLEAKTLHRLLGYKYLSVSFEHAKENQLDADIVAIDECSMIDLPMMSKLLDAIPDGCDLYLLGDKNQLASVEAGSVFADICEKLKDDENIYRKLTKNYRSDNGINALSKQILEESIENFNNEDVRHYESDKLESELFSRYEKLFSAKNKEEALDFLKTFQILCATKVGQNGTEQINRKFHNLAKKRNAKYFPIMITENNYHLNLFNGDVGVKDKDLAYFGAETFPVLTLPRHELAYAITIHKSQGSEYDCVAVVYPNEKMEKEAFLTKELLYTAITRAKKECLLFGSKEILLDSCKKEIFRASGIAKLS